MMNEDVTMLHTWFLTSVFLKDIMSDAQAYALRAGHRDCPTFERQLLDIEDKMLDMFKCATVNPPFTARLYFKLHKTPM